jgi:DNA-binding transcriptional LysR family regulator
MKHPNIPMEYWSAFVAVVEQGSFARAAEHLNKSQSAISYAVSKLEELLPTPVLRQQGRKAVITKEGEVLYRQAKSLLEQAAGLEQTAQCLAAGWETQLHIAIESIVPVEPVLRAMKAFAEAHPQTRLTLLETTLSGTDEAILEKRADLALCTRVPPGFLAKQVYQVQMIPVAHSSHPLARAKHALTEQDLKQARQIVIRDSGQKRNQDAGWLQTEQRFTVSHFATALKVLESGLGFAFPPRWLVAKGLADGSLKKLNLEKESERAIPIQLLHTQQDHTGPALKLFSELLTKAFADQ